MIEIEKYISEHLDLTDDLDFIEKIETHFKDLNLKCGYNENIITLDYIFQHKTYNAEIERLPVDNLYN